MLGVLIAATGLLVVLLTLLVGLLALPGAVLTVGVVTAGAVVLAGVWFLTRDLVVVRLDDAGYQVRWVRGAGMTRARWTDVEDVVAATHAGERCVILRLRDGRTTTIPVRMLAGVPDDFVKDLRAHLDAGHGYRRIT